MEYQVDNITYKDYNIKHGGTVTTFKPFEFCDLFACADPAEIPAARYLAGSVLMSYIAMKPTLRECLEQLDAIKNKIKQGKADDALPILEVLEAAMSITDPVQKWLNLGKVFLLTPDCSPDNPKHTANSFKVIMTQKQAERKRIAVWVEQYYYQLIQRLSATAPELFQGDGQGTFNFRNFVEQSARHQDQINMLLNRMSGGVYSERDLLMTYPIGGLAYDMRLFILKTEKDNKNG